MIAEPLNVATHLGRLASTQPYSLAVVFPEGRDGAGQVAYTHWTYFQLNAMASRYALGLQRHGLKRGMRTALLVKPSLPFFGLTFALFKLGAVPVFIDPGIGVRNFGQCLNEAEPEAFIGTLPAHAARLLLGWGRESIRLLVTVGRRWGWGGTTLRALVSGTPADSAFSSCEVSADETAAILFTSGSTGPPKGAVYTHGMFSSQVRMLRELYDLQPGEVDLCTFPLFALFAPALGWTAVVPDMDFSRPGSVNPAHILEAIDNWGVTTMFGSPALLERIANSTREGTRALPSLRRVISAGAPVRPDILQRFSSLLAPDVPIHTPYGATEALPIASISSQSILSETRHATAAGKGNCVGRPVSGMTVRIMRITAEELATWRDDYAVGVGEIGEIVVQGPVVSAKYYGRPEATRHHKMHDSAGEIIHRTGDVGYFDAQGRLWFCGRKSHRVTTANGDLFTLPCEGVFNVHPKVRRTALVGVPRDQCAEPVLCVELRPEVARQDHEHIRQQLLALGSQYDHTRGIQRILFHPSFPVDIRHNAKIFREKLALWAIGKRQ